MHKIGQSGGFLGRLLGPLLKTELPLIGSVLRSLTKSVLIPLGLTAAAAAAAAAAGIDAAINKKMFEFGNTTLIILNEEMNDRNKGKEMREIYTIRAREGTITAGQDF